LCGFSEREVMVKKYLTLFLLTLSVASCAPEDKVSVKATPSEVVEGKCHSGQGLIVAIIRL